MLFEMPFGDTDEAQTTKALEMFFEHKRPHGQDLQEFTAEWDLRYEDARSKAGLDINAVAKSYMWLRQAGLPQRHQDDLRLQVHGDLSRFNDLRTLAVRLSHRVDKGNSTGDVFYEQDKHDDTPEDDGWYEDELYWADSWWDEDFYQHVSEDHAETWYGDEEYFDPYEQWPGDPAAEPGYQGEDHPDEGEAETVYSSGGGRGRGAGAFGSGCHVCGSKWHHAADCPVRGKGFGHDGGKSKGKYGKGKTKGKGKGKFRPKGKAGGKGRPKGWSSKGSWSSPAQVLHLQRPLRRGLRLCQGLQLGDSPPKLQPAKATKYFGIDKDLEVKQDYFEDLLKLERSGRLTAPSSSSNEATEADQGSSAPPAPTVKNLSFFVRKISGEDSDGDTSPRHRTYHEQPDNGDVFHTVAGQRRRGLIIDPGAANGLVGSETLRDLLAHVDMARQVESTLEWRPKRSEVTGISGAADTTLGEITMMLPMLSGLEGANYKADVIGGDACSCRESRAGGHEVDHGLELVHEQGRLAGDSHLGQRLPSHTTSLHGLATLPPSARRGMLNFGTCRGGDQAQELSYQGSHSVVYQMEGCTSVVYEGDYSKAKAESNRSVRDVGRGQRKHYHRNLRGSGTTTNSYRRSTTPDQEGHWGQEGCDYR